MEVFLIPVGREAYELYCEISDEAEEHAGAPPAGLLKSLVHRFRATLAAAERERLRASDPSDRRARATWTHRVKRRAMRWVAERIAEQRLLWHLRRQADVVAVYPVDLDEARAMAIVREHLGREADRHVRWLIVDTLGLLVSAALVLVPGPNVVAYYFAFRCVGHFLSIRGARHGLREIRWTARPSEPLAELRYAMVLAPPERHARVGDIASRLRLRHLASFFERTSLPTA